MSSNRPVKLVIAICITQLFIFMFQGCAGTTNTYSKKQDAQWSYDHEDYEAAKSAYQAVLEAKPEDPEANYGLAKALVALGDYAGARTPMEIAYNDAWARVDLAYNIAVDLALIYSKCELYDELFTFLRQRAENSGLMRDSLLLGQYAAKCGDPDTAEHAFLVAMRIDDSGSAEPYYNLALLYEQLGDSKSAEMRLRQAYGLSPDDKQIISKLERYVGVVGPTVALPPDK